MNLMWNQSATGSRLAAHEETGDGWISLLLGFCQLSMRMRVEVREGKPSSKLNVILTVDPKRDKNGIELNVPAKCVSVEIATLIFVNTHVKVILEKKILAIM